MDDPPGQLCQAIAVVVPGHDHLEFIAAETADPAALPHRAFEPARDLLEQRVASGVPHRIVDLLEAIEIEQEYRAGAVLEVRGRDDLFQSLRHLKAVGEPGERVVVCQPRCVFLRTLLFGQVASRTAKPDKVAKVIIKRTARYRPPALFTARGCAQRQLVESRAGCKVKGERALAVLPRGIRKEQFHEGPSRQPPRILAEAWRDNARCGQCAEAWRNSPSAGMG